MPSEPSEISQSEPVGEVPSAEMGFATVDLDRERRTGFPEVVMGQGKTPEHIAEIAKRIYDASGMVLVTRSDAVGAEVVKAVIPTANFIESCGAIWADDRGLKPEHKGLVVVSAGTADMAVADEAEIVAKLMLCDVRRINDVGVAGIHRLLAHKDVLQAARAIVVVAGMDGALPSVVGGLVEAPVIAVPTSNGYGTGLEGFSAMLTMLNSCSPGVSVVNIVAGFSAGYQAALICRAG
ncbi:MAG: nickel pincer cofactor biosynthesis protein LarB [Chloroflexi bacterium]|nr:nickel pincer cofactor biosynthesis protein LarB [Chloroflexota bacterium]